MERGSVKRLCSEYKIMRRLGDVIIREGVNEWPGIYPFRRELSGAWHREGLKAVAFSQHFYTGSVARHQITLGEQRRSHFQPEGRLQRRPRPPQNG